jgi:DNA-binding Lrp family transcriptional regulator
MAELKAGSIVFVRVSAGKVDKAVRDIQKNENVIAAEPVLGPYDVVVTGGFKDSAALRKFSEDLENEEFCEECVAYPTYEDWSREEKEELPWNAWTLVKTRDAEATKAELKRISAVNKYFLTTGEYGVIARLSAKNPEKLHETVMRELQKVEGVHRTETFPAIQVEL